MEVTINYNGQAVAVEVTLEVYEFLDRADHKTENLFHEQRRHWDGREFDEYIITTEGVGVYSETPEEYLCRMETLHELMAVLDMTIVGSLQSGLTGDHQMLFTKSMLDFVSSMIFASSLGLGVLFAAGFVLVFQGGITLLAGLAAPFLGDAVIAEMTCVGSVLIIGLGLNMLGLTKLKVMNYLPAIFLPILLCLLW